MSLRILTLGFALAMPLSLSAAEKPNVLFIALDDMNDGITLLDPEGPIQTPHLERLAARGMNFTRAYCASPACNPSRAAVLTGLRPSTSGVYGNKSDWRQAIGDTPTLMRHFRDQGYRVEGSGKIFHHHLGGAFHDEESFDDFLPMPDPPDTPMPAEKLNGLADYGSANTDWGAWPAEAAEHLDVRTVDYCLEKLEANAADNAPWFLAAGIFRPHMPFFAPQDWLDRYPTENLVLPTRLEGDLNDIPSGGIALWEKKRWFWDGMMEAEQKSPGTWAEAVRCYQASAAFADHQAGRLLTALEAHPDLENTVIILWSDHGYHLGEKNHWEKFTLWEKANRVPFIIVAPGVTTPSSICDRPVDLSAIFPTLVDLCGLPDVPTLDGLSLRTLLENPQASWEQPAIMTYERGNHAVRSDGWRYIRYADGSEELYDHNADPNEHHNLAGDPQWREVMDEHANWIPQSEAKPVPPLKPSRKP